MKRAKDYRDLAKYNCDPYVKVLMLITLITLAIEFVISFSIIKEVNVDGVLVRKTEQPLAWLSIFLTGQVAMGWVYVNANVCRGIRPYTKTFFRGFDNYFKATWAYLLQGIYLLLWGIITFGIGSIIKSFSYSMTYNILVDNPQMSVNEAITESRRLMKGHKWRLFCLEFSYIGWMLLCALTLGILSLWVTPRMQQANYLFYRDLREKDYLSE